MGRPLNKKYFGNRNIGRSTPKTDNGIGGEGIASINWSNQGAFRGNGTLSINGLALPAPTLPTGVQATWTLKFEVESVTTGAGKTGLAVGDTFGHANLAGMVAKVTNVSGANAVFSVTTSGASRGLINLADIMTDTQGLTLTKIAGPGSAGTFLVDVNYRISTATAIVEKGSGYTGAETFTVTITSNGPTPTTIEGTIVLTTDTGAVGTQTNQENAIITRAYIPESGSQGYISGAGGSSAVVGDIVKQVGSNKYVVRTSQGVGRCKLVAKANGDLLAGEMNIVATDSDNNTYFVTKLTAHRARLQRIDGGESGVWVHASGTHAPWSFAAASGSIVKIDNA